MRVMQIDLEDCDVKQHRTKLTIEFTSNVGSLAQIRSLGREDPLEEGMATHSSIFAWGIP